MFRARVPSIALHKRLVRGIRCFRQLLQLSSLICFLNKGKINGSFIHYQDTQRNISHLVQKLRTCHKVGGSMHTRVGGRVLGEQAQSDRSWLDCEGVRVVYITLEVVYKADKSLKNMSTCMRSKVCGAKQRS